MYMSKSMFPFQFLDAYSHIYIGKLVSIYASGCLFPYLCQKTCFHVRVGKLVYISKWDACSYVCVRKHVFMYMSESLFQLQDAGSHLFTGKPVFMYVSESLLPQYRDACFHVCVKKHVFTEVLIRTEI